MLVCVPLKIAKSLSATIEILNGVAFTADAVNKPTDNAAAVNNAFFFIKNPLLDGHMLPHA